MLHRVHTRRAPTLKDLLLQIDAATYRLGLDAGWTGHKDGRIYVWRKDHYAELGIQPETKYPYELEGVKVVE